MYNMVKNGETKQVGNRTIVNLNGIWQVEDSLDAEDMPVNYIHTVPVPGLMSSANPPFEKVGDFETRFRQYCKDNWRQSTGGKTDLPVDENALKHHMGVAYQNRNYFWYKRIFKAPNKHTFALLNVLKARYGSKIWLNGHVIGESISCFTSEQYDVSEIIKWNEENEIIVRVGAHQGVLPEGNTCNEDCEQEKWYPGIWDDIELYCYENSAIRSVQIAPKVAPKQIFVQTEVENSSDKEVIVKLEHLVKKTDLKTVLAKTTQMVTIGAGKTLMTECTIDLPDAELWTPENPNLYILETDTEGDSEINRFGLREAYFRTSTRRFYLNHEICFLRGGLICSERWFQDPLCGQTPWDENWLHKIMGENRRLMSWNVTKWCLNDVPRKWLEVADEEGLMSIPDFPIWCFNPERPEGFQGYVKDYNIEWLKHDVTAWVKDCRNHPSVIYWSAANETCAKWMDEVIIPTGRSLDLQNRAWLNSYNPPLDPDDPQENHPYSFTTNGLPDEWNVPGFDMLNLENMDGHGRHSAIGIPGVPTGHAQVISEYGWLWCTRKGEPGLYLTNTYHKLPYPHDTPEERLETWNYLLAGLTEYWRAHRNYTQVVYNAWLAGDMGPGHAAVIDNYKDPVKGEFQPAFIKYVREAFKPMGVYLEFWKRELQAGENRVFYVMMINDYLNDKKGEVTVRFEYNDGTCIEIEKKQFRVTANGQQTLLFDITIPQKLGKATMIATAISDDGLTTLSQRWVEVKEEIPPRPYGQW